MSHWVPPGEGWPPLLIRRLRPLAIIAVSHAHLALGL
jgi:hypothetical protein